MVKSGNVYTVSVKSTTAIGQYTIVPKFNGVQIGSLAVTLATTAPRPATDKTIIKLDKSSYAFEENMVVTVTVRNKNGYLLVGQTDWLSNGGYGGKGIMVDGGKIKDTEWIDNGDGTYTRTYTAWNSGARSSYIAINSYSKVNSNKYTINHGAALAEYSSIDLGGNSFKVTTYSPIYFKVTIRDKANNVIKDDLDAVRNNIVVPENVTVYNEWSVCSDNTISYCRSYLPYKAGSNLTVTLKLPDWNSEISSQTFRIVTGDIDKNTSTITLDKYLVQIGDVITVTVKMADVRNNPVTNWYPYGHDNPNNLYNECYYISGGYGFQRMTDWLQQSNGNIQLHSKQL